MNDKQLENMTFVASNLGAEYYESDLKLYEKLYPSRPALGEFKNAPEYRKQHFQERMLLEILDAVCTDTVLENRGFVVFKGDKTKLPDGESKEAAQKSLLDADISKLTYPQKKALVKVLDLKTENQKDATVTAALYDLKDELLKAAEEAEKVKVDDKEAEAAKAAEEAEAAKKKEGQE